MNTAWIHSSFAFVVLGVGVISLSASLCWQDTLEPWLNHDRLVNGQRAPSPFAYKESDEDSPLIYAPVRSKSVV